MEFKAKTFEELSGCEVYEILKARAAVFVKEQGISYVDEDDVDYQSLHCFFWDDGRVRGYLRAYHDDRHNGDISIGRVLTTEHGKGIGTSLMKQSIPAIKKRLQCDRLRMDAQKHAVSFYERLGFKVTSGEYLEEGVVHVDMELKPPEKADPGHL